VHILRRTDSDDTIVILGLAGDLDVAALPSVQSAVDQALNAGCERLIVDLSQVDSVDANGAGLLGATQSQCVSADVALVLVVPHTELRDRLDHAGVGNVTIVNSLDRARNAAEVETR